MAEVGHGKHREALALVVIPGVIAEGPLLGGIARGQRPFEQELGPCGHEQIGHGAAGEFRLAAPQQPGESRLTDVVGHRRHRGENGGRIRAEGHRNREGLPRTRLLPFAEIQRAAALRQPAHDQPVLPQELHAVDTEVLSLLVRSAGDDERPGDANYLQH